MDFLLLVLRRAHTCAPEFSVLCLCCCRFTDGSAGPGLPHLQLVQKTAQSCAPGTDLFIPVHWPYLYPSTQRQ
jgi:hypothetical protein